MDVNLAAQRLEKIALALSTRAEHSILLGDHPDSNTLGTAQGGFDLSRIDSTLVIAVLMASMVLVTRRKAGAH